jgi:hypothetical protein
MKNIDEFATEYAQDKYLPVQTSQAVKSGANYVLKELEKECRRIEQLFKNYVENPVNGEDKVDALARLDEMEYMLKFIEQLKKLREE